MLKNILKLRRYFKAGIVLATIFVVLGQEVHAQRTSAEIADSLAISCFEKFEGLKAIGVSTSDEYPSIKSGLYSYWRGLGIEIFETKEASSVNEKLDRRIQYRVDSASIKYLKEGRKNYLREVQLVIYESSTGSDFKVLSNDRCERSSSDTVLRSLTMNDPSDFKVDLERGGRFGFVKPVILTATLGAISYLFFTVRSSE